MKTAEKFINDNFNGIDKLLYYPVIVALAQGYADYVLSNSFEKAGCVGKTFKISDCKDAV